jgi:hypothetical protein
MITYNFVLKNEIENKKKFKKKLIKRIRTKYKIK